MCVFLNERMFFCVSVCVYVCMSACSFVCLCVFMCLCVFVGNRVCVRVLHVCACVCDNGTQTFVYAFVYKHLCICV